MDMAGITMDKSIVTKVGSKVGPKVGSKEEAGLIMTEHKWTLSVYM